MLGTESRYNPTHVCPYLQPLAGWSGVGPPDTQLTFGTSDLPLVVTEGVSVFDYTFESESTSGSTSVEPFSVYTEMKGAAGVGGRALFHTYSNVELGGWANAVKGYMEFGDSGRVTGMASAVLGELALNDACTQGNYAPLESELSCTENGNTGTATGFLYGNFSGHSTGIDTLNDNGYLFILGSGITDTADGLFEAEDSNDIDMTHSLRVLIAGTPYYIALSTSKDFTD